MNTATENVGTWRSSTGALSKLSTRYDKYVIYLMPSISLLIWAISLIQAKGVAIEEYGIFSVLPFTYYLAVYVLLTSMFFTIFIAKNCGEGYLMKALLFQSFLLMVFLLFTPSIIEGYARSPHSWSKYGYVDYIVRTGHISQSLTHYHNWPLPFIFSAQTVQITGIDPVTFPLIFPLILDMIIFSVIILFFFRFFKDNRIRFIGIILFFLVTWENQFHFAPQLFGFLLLLFVIYLVVFYLKKENLKMLILLGLMVIVLILTHLLTAFVACLFLGLFVLYQIFWPKPKARRKRRKKKFRLKWLVKKKFWKAYWHKVLKKRIKSLVVSRRILGLLAAIGIGGLIFWFSFAGNWVRYANWGIDLSLLPALASAYINKLYSGSDAHGNLVLIRMVFSLTIAILAIWGGKLARDKRNNRMLYIIILSAIVPIFLFYYEVEIVQRAFLFCGLPLAVLISLGLDKKKFLAIVLVFSFIAVPLHILTMYGNEKIDYTPPSQVGGAEFVFDNMPIGSVILGGNPVDRGQYVENYRRISYSEVDFFEDSGRDLYIIYCSSDEYFSLWYHENTVYIDFLKNKIAGDDYIKIFDSPDCQIYKYVG